MTWTAKRTLKGRALKASALSLAVALGLTACSNDYTVSYVYMITQGISGSNNHSLLNSYQVDYQSGYLYPMADSPNDTGGRDGVALVTAPNNLYLYTVNNFDSDVVEFAIGTDGKLYPENTYNITGSFPVAAAIDAAGKFLYVAFTYQNNPDGSPLYTTANPGPGGITVFPINSDNTLGKPLPLCCAAGRNPVAIATATNAGGSYVYLLEQDSASSGNIIGFVENPSTGALTLMPGQTINPANGPSSGFASGPSPSGVIVDSSASHLFVGDNSLNQIWTYTIGPGGVPTPTSTVPSDAGPMGMSFDLQGKYLYVAASTANVIDGYDVASGGVLTRSSVAGTTQAGIGPTCVTVSGAPSNAHPTHSVYLYASNSLSDNITAEQVDESTGALVQTMGSPFGGSKLPACIATVPALPLR